VEPSNQVEGRTVNDRLGRFGSSANSKADVAWINDEKREISCCAVLGPADFSDVLSTRFRAAIVCMQKGYTALYPALGDEDNLISLFPLSSFLLSPKRNVTLLTKFAPLIVALMRTVHAILCTSL
jgi:hypothetical protein